MRPQNFNYKGPRLNNGRYLNTSIQGAPFNYNERYNLQGSALGNQYIDRLLLNVKDSDLDQSYFTGIKGSDIKTEEDYDKFFTNIQQADKAFDPLVNHYMLNVAPTNKQFKDNVSRKDSFYDNEGFFRAVVPKTLNEDTFRQKFGFLPTEPSTGYDKFNKSDIVNVGGKQYYFHQGDSAKGEGVYYALPNSQTKEVVENNTPTPPPVTPAEEPKTPLDLKTPEEPVKETATPVGNQEPPGADFDYSPQMRANLLNLMGNLFANRSNRGTYTPFKLPTQSLIRPVDQAAMTNSMMNNVYSNNAFQTANRNLPSSVQQSFLNQATGNMFKNLPVEGVTKYYNDFSNNQINAHNQFMNNLYGQEKFLWDDQRKAMDQIRRGYALAGNARLNALGKYFNANAKLETETPWAFIQAGMKPVRLGDGKWRGLYDKSTQELQRRVMDWEQTFGNKDLDNLSKEELVGLIKSQKNKS